MSERHQHMSAAQSGARPLNTLAAFQVVPTGAALGAEIRGVDFSLSVPEDVKEALRKAWADHLVLLFRGQNINDDELLAAAGIFGPPHEAASRKYHLATGKGIDDKHLLSRHPSIVILSNLDSNGQPVRDNGDLGSYEVMWHTDNSYVAVPPAGRMRSSCRRKAPAATRRSTISIWRTKNCRKISSAPSRADRKCTIPAATARACSDRA
jgi:alpha-ketoglutarate-dependent taurine dioxygenase